MSRKGTGAVSCFGPSELAHRQDYEAEKCTDITVPVRKGAPTCGELVQNPGGDLYGPRKQSQSR